MRQTNQTPISVIGNRVRVERQQAWEYHFDPSAVPRAQIGSADGKAGDFVMRTRYRVGIDGTPSSGKPGKHISDAGHVYLRNLDPVPRWRSLPFHPEVGEKWLAGRNAEKIFGVLEKHPSTQMSAKAERSF